MSLQPCLLSPRSNQNDHTSWCHDTTDVREKLQVMRRFEATSYAAKNYLPLQTQARIRQRRLTVEYLYQVVDFGGFQRDVVAYSMTHLMDRYLATQAGKRALEDGNHYQLVALTCLYMAVKLLEPQNIGIDSLVPLSNGVYTRQEFLAMERGILEELNWCVAQGPTPLAYVQLLMPLMHLDNDKATSLYNHVQYQLELGVSDYSLCCAKPSELAVAALWNGLESMDWTWKENTRVGQAVLDALRWEHNHQECHIANLQAKLRHLMLAAFSLTTSAASKLNNAYIGTVVPKQSGGASPVSTVRKEPGDGSSPSSSGHDSIHDVTEVDWLQHAY